MHANISAELSAPQRQKLSAFIVCFNEEREIADCLKTLAFCDEIIVVDSFSTDRTVEICESFGARVIQRAWPGYRAQKEFGLRATTHEWVLNLDADERVSPELRRSIEAVLAREWQIEHGELDASGTRPDGYDMNRVVYYLGRWWRRGGWYPEYRVRLMRKSKVVWGGVDPHERPEVNGPIARLEGELEHYTYRSLDEQLRRLHAHASIAAQEEFKREAPTVGLKRLVLNPLVRMFKFYFLKRGYREGIAGVLVTGMEGFYTFLKYAKLWEFQHDPERVAGERSGARE